MRIFPALMITLLIIGMSSCLCRLQFNEYNLEDNDLALIADFNAREIAYVDEDGTQYKGNISSRRRQLISDDTDCERNTLESAFVDINITDLEVAFRVSVLKTDIDRSFFDLVRTDESEFFFVRDCSSTNSFNCKETALARGEVFEEVLDLQGRDTNELVERIIYKPEMGIVFLSFKDGRSFQLEQ